MGNHSSLLLKTSITEERYYTRSPANIIQQKNSTIKININEHIIFYLLKNYSPDIYQQALEKLSFPN